MEDELIEALEQHPVERQQRWLGIAKTMPPEELAAFVESGHPRWVVITETGGLLDRIRRTAYLNSSQDLPYWAFALAKSFLDDVGEWPLFGLQTELAFDDWEEHQDPIRAVREILASVKPVWSDLDVLYVGEEKG